MIAVVSGGWSFLADVLAGQSDWLVWPWTGIAAACIAIGAPLSAVAYEQRNTAKTKEAVAESIGVTVNVLRPLMEKLRMLLASQDPQSQTSVQYPRCPRRRHVAARATSPRLPSRRR